MIAEKGKGNMKRPSLHPASGQLPRRVITLLVVFAVVAAFNAFLYGRSASGHDNASYAYIEENSVGAYRGVIGSGDFSNPDLGTGSFTNATLWAVDNGECGGVAWIEVGWSKRADWGGQARHKFMWLVAPNCVFTIWPFNLGTPAVGPFYEYRLLYSSSNNRWEYFINGQIKAAKVANWTSADLLEVGDELKPPGNASIEMGPNHFQTLRYRLLNGSEVSFYYHDFKHCDVTPPLYPYHFIYPVSAPDWIYIWGPAAGSQCGSGGP